ncbi:hypothetical protein QTN47_04810 [Danxiaibacter flavus]|uniref:Uncharacterized protein n=1 Tax=Danxiaibacter flavus TaxID=3049108 RepID=A0ABV3ZAB2_9BACT|nr:hypothetical protein QNM32_04810 [Chitinophagaceae bacterium DXS]
MNEKQPTITQELEQLFQKTAEANKIFFKESTRFVQQLGSSGQSGEDLFNKQKQLFGDALKSLVQLNIQHASNLLDLGIAVAKRFNQSSNTSGADVSSTDENAVVTEPAFVLTAVTSPGETANVQFMLDSSKAEPVSCKLIKNKFILQEDRSVQADFETLFTPQSFQLLPGEQQRVEISVQVPGDVRPGIYISDIRVEGFEHIFFQLNLTINPIANPDK